MGTVYLATQVGLGRQVVLKVLLEKFANDPVAVARFESEAQAVSQLNQPNIVTLYEYGRSEKGTVFLAMEYCPGKTLLDWLRNGAVPPDDAKDIALGIAKALKAAHAAGIVHRDLKPENIMLTESPTEGRVVKVLDFGLAKMDQQDQSQGLTADDVIMGTPGYMSPEQIAGKKLDPRSDIYALGVIWWEMLTGRPLFTAESYIQVLVKHTNEPATPLSQIVPGKVDAATENLILGLCQKQASARPLDGGAVVEHIGRLQEQNANMATNLKDVDDFFSGSAPSSPGVSDSHSLDDLCETHTPPAPTPPVTTSPAPSVSVAPSEESGPPANDYMAMMADVEDNDVIPGGIPFSLGDTGSGVEDPEFDYAAAVDVGREDSEPHASAAAPSIAPGMPPSPQPAGLLWQVSAFGRITTQVPLVELRRWIQQGKVTAHDDVAPMGQTLKPLPEYASFAALLKSLRQQEQEKQNPGKKQKRRKPKKQKKDKVPGGYAYAKKPRRWPLFVGGFVLLIVGSVGGLYVADRATFDELAKDAERMFSDVVDDVKSQVAGDGNTRLAPWIEKWKKVHTEVPDSVPELLTKVERLLKNPTPVSREKAKALLEQALVKAPTHPSATALYLQNSATQRGATERLAALRATKVLEDLSEASIGNSDLQTAKAALFSLASRHQDALNAATAGESAASTPAQQARAKRWKARAQLDMGALKESQITIAAATALAPQNTEISLLQAEVAFAQGRLQVALKNTAKRVQAVREDGGAARLLAHIQREQTSAQAAARPLVVLLKKDADDDVTREFLARLYIDAGERKIALRVLKAAPEMDVGKGSVGPTRARLLAQQANLLVAKGKVVEARKWIRRALRGGTKSALAHRVLGRIHEVMGDAVKAKMAFETAASLAPSPAFAAACKAEAAMAFLLSSSPKDAEQLASQALQVDANNLLAHQVRLAAVVEQKKITAGHASLTELLALNPRVGLFDTRLQLLPPLKKQQKRLAEYVSKLSVPKASAPFKNVALGVVHFHGLRPKRASKPFTKAIRRKRDLALPVLLLAHLDVKKGNPKKAIRKLRALIVQHESPLQAQLLLAELEIKAGKLDAAKQRLTSLEQKAQQSAQVLMLRGNLAKEERDFQNARKYWLDAVEADRYYTPARVALRSF
ncbi:MAG: protein kinase [Deltaproteobacteria bacterium]|nr:protein kinase [Deltaproteobacteria bacterium]